MSNHTHLVSAIQSLKSRIPEQGEINQRLHSLASQAQDSVAALIHIKNNPSPTATAASNFIALQANAKKLGAWHVRAGVTLNNIMRDAYGAADTQLHAKINLVANPTFEREIRDLYRSLSVTERVSYLASLAMKNNGPALAAIIEADHDLTGIDKEIADKFRKSICNTHAPREMEAIGNINLLIEPLWAILDLVKSTVAMFSDIYKLQGIEQLQLLAEQAEATMNRTLTA